jgi:hypothetical protein
MFRFDPYSASIAKFKAGDLSISPERAKENLKIFERLSKESHVQIKQYQAWMGQLKPYLIKAVSFFDEEKSFYGHLTPKDLVIGFGAVLGPKARLAMKRMPAVAYLPQKPPHVYTEMSNLD